MSRWTIEQRRAAAQRRAEAQAPLLAHAGLVQVAPPAKTGDDYRADFQRSMAVAEERCKANVAFCRKAIAEGAPERLAAYEAQEAKMHKWGLEVGMLADHWTNAYRETFGRLPPYFEETQRALDYVAEKLARDRDSKGEQLDLMP